MTSKSQKQVLDSALKRQFDICVPQSVNSENSEFIRGVHCPIFIKNYIGPVVKSLGLKGIKRTSFIRLVSSVAPHEDIDFCTSEGYRKAFVYVYKMAKSKYNNNDWNNQFIYSPWFYANGKWLEMKEKGLYEFDPRKTHAVMTEQRLDLMVFWR